MSKEIHNWHTVDHDSHTSVAGELHVNGVLLFAHFDTYNPTIVAADEASCQVSTGNVYKLIGKRML
jgi:hypothetical protein